MESAHPLIDTSSNHHILLEYRSDSDGPQDADHEERTDKLSPAALHEVMAEISVLPPEYAVEDQIIEQFIGTPEGLATAEFDALTRFTMNTGQVFERGTLLGAGSQASVYEATQVAGVSTASKPMMPDELGRVRLVDHVADSEQAVLKIIRVPAGRNPRYAYREISAWADKKKFSAQSVSLVGVKQYITDQKERIFVIALERRQGRDLGSRIEAPQFVQEQQTAAFRLELMDAGLACFMELDFMSRPEQGEWLHNDIKPGNVLLHGIFSSLLDWGLAHKEAESIETIERNGAYGTVAYLSPDKFIPETAFHRNPDWYDMGLTLAKALGSMQFYFEVDNTESVLAVGADNNTLKFDSDNIPGSDSVKNILNRLIMTGTVVVSEQLTEANYHDVLREQFPLSPERDFAWLCYQLVQPHCRPGQYVPAFTNYGEIIAELTAMTQRQRLRLRTKKLLNDLERFRVSRFQLRREDASEVVPKLIHSLEQALLSDQDELMEEITEITRQYFKDTRQTVLGDRPAIQRVHLGAEQSDLQVARFNSLKALVVSLIELLITNYQHQAQDIPASFTKNLMEGVQLAERHFADDAPEVGFGILHLMQQDLSRLQLAREQGEQVQLRYYNYNDLIDELKFDETAEEITEEATTESKAA